MSDDPTFADNWLVFDTVRIDVSGHRLLVGGVQVAIEPKAFSVLLLLAQSPGRVFTRDEILDAVWEHSHVTPGVLNRIVTLLRHALRESAEHSHHLSTVHGVGYRLDAQLRREDSSRTPTQELVDVALAGPDVGAAGPPPDRVDPIVVAVSPEVKRRRSRRLPIVLGGMLAIALIGLAYRAGRQPTPALPVALGQANAAATVRSATSRSLIVLPLRAARCCGARNWPTIATIRGSRTIFAATTPSTTGNFTAGRRSAVWRVTAPSANDVSTKEDGPTDATPACSRFLPSQRTPDETHLLQQEVSRFAVSL